MCLEDRTDASILPSDTLHSGCFGWEFLCYVIGCRSRRGKVTNPKETDGGLVEQQIKDEQCITIQSNKHKWSAFIYLLQRISLRTYVRTMRRGHPFISCSTLDMLVLLFFNIW